MTSGNEPRPGDDLDVSRMPIYALLSHLGKRVVRPGGVGLTRQMLDLLNIQPSDEVVEFAPGVGATAKITLSRDPARYTAIERDEASARLTSRYLKGPNQECVIGRAEQTGLPDASATVVYGEAMLAMQTTSNQERVIAEAVRILKPGGKYGIHEPCLIPNDVDEATKIEIERALFDVTHVAARPGTQSEWCKLLEEAGLQVTGQATAGFGLLSPPRLLRDEGPLGTLKLIRNVLRDKVARRRVLAMRSVLRRYRHSLGSIAIVAVKPE